MFHQVPNESSINIYTKRSWQKYANKICVFSINYKCILYYIIPIRLKTEKYPGKLTNHFKARYIYTFVQQVIGRYVPGVILGLLKF